nr:unnamed protein product [Digitaria exilis]
MTPPLITPVIKDEEGRMISRTMRATDELQVLMDFYYHTVPVVPHGEGVFCYKGQVLDGGLAPGDYGMASGDRVDFFLEMRPDTFVTVTVRDARGPEVTRTMRMTDAMQDLFEFYFEMTAHVDGTFAQIMGLTSVTKRPSE